jgi:hypothetical protein
VRAALDHTGEGAARSAGRRVAARSSDGPEERA